MTMINSNAPSKEELLSIQWLNKRRRYDAQARSQRLIQSALSGMTCVSNPVIADLGCGTGGTSLQLIEYFRDDFTLILIEQHEVLLIEAKKQFAGRYGLAIDTDGRGIMNLENATVQVKFVHSNIYQWLECNSNVNLYICGALLDLLTQSEIVTLVHKVAHGKAALFASLNYTGAVILPESEEDRFVVGLFEQHMVRRLDRGCPLGPACVDQIHRITDSIPTLRMTTESSDWQVKFDDPEFLEMNMEFYLNGAKATAKTDSELSLCQKWRQKKKKQITGCLLELRVFHQDLLLS